MTNPKLKTLSVFTLAMMTVAAVVSLRGLPMMAKEGLSMFYYIGFGTVFFLLPASLVSAELGGAFAHIHGGIYAWVKAAFGSRWGFVAIWLQWTESIVLYPTILGFAAASLAYLFIDPSLAAAGWYNALVIVVVYWTATFVTLRGSQFATSVTTWAFLLGTVVPGVLLIVLAALWVIGGGAMELLQAAGPDPAALGHQVHPHFGKVISGLDKIAFLAGILLLFAGVEVQAVHGTEMRDPPRQYPAAMFLAMVVSFLLFSLGALAVATVIPVDKISLTAGMMQAFQDFLARFGLAFLTPVMGLLLAAGAIGGVMAWIGGPSKGLLATARQGELPPFLARVNKHGVQINILLIQGAMVTALAALYVVMDDVSVAFFLLSAMTITVYLAMYILMYAAAIKLRYSAPDLAHT
jgi:amino acid transporter